MNLAPKVYRVGRERFAIHLFEWADGWELGVVSKPGSFGHLVPHVSRTYASRELAVQARDQFLASTTRSQTPS